MRSPSPMGSSAGRSWERVEAGSSCSTAPTVIDEYLRTMEEVGRGLPRAEIARAVDVLFGCWQREGTVFTAGNGGSASTATHLACDLAKATIVPGRRRLKTGCLVDNI